jgi:HAMP domain-containing protein
MEEDNRGKAAGERASRTGKTVKWAFVIMLAATAGIIGFFTIFRTHPAQAAVEKAFEMVEQGDAEGLMEYVDPQGELGRMWEENTDGMRDTILSVLDGYRLDFSSLKFATRAGDDAAEVELKGGHINIYERGLEGLPTASLDLGGSGLIFYVERREGVWLIEGVNYDLKKIFSGELDFFPF